MLSNLFYIFSFVSWFIDCFV